MDEERTEARVERRKTQTSNFGVSRRESHDSSRFYGRFRPPVLDLDDAVPPPAPIEEPFVVGNAVDMSTIADGSVALVVTSPPYFAGKQYEEELDRDGIPSSYLEYLEMLTDVFAECVRTLEPGGRIAVNVANLGRKPYRSLSADVIRILEHDLGLLLRGELVWQKAEGASGSCAWGSFRSASNPVLRDLTERVIVASKGRFDRARSVKERAAAGLPHRSTMMTDDFMALTLDVWTIPPERAKRVGHPAPFPVELPEQLIRLYTFENDLVLDPFMGSGSTLVAAARLGRRYAGYDLDPGYVEMARRRVHEVVESSVVNDADPGVRRIAGDGRSVHKLAAEALDTAGFVAIERSRRVPGSGAVVAWTAVDAGGGSWYFDVGGAFLAQRGGLTSIDLVWKAIGRAAAVGARTGPAPFVLLTTALPRPRSDGDQALRAAGPGIVFDVIDLLDDDALDRLARYATGGREAGALPGFWTMAELGCDR